MTLVVAQQRKKVIAVVSDTGIIEHDAQLPPDRQLPKICILAPDLAVAFAGSAELAKRYLENFPEAARNYKTVTEYLLSCHLKSEESVDFLALFNKPIPKIVPIRSGKVCEAVRSAWLGDPTAFENFQRHRHTQDHSSVASVVEGLQLQTIFKSEVHQDNATFQLLGALRYVLFDPKIEAAFGVGVAMNNVDGDFRYRAYTLVLNERPFFFNLTSEQIIRLEAERAEMRGFAASCFVTNHDAAVQGLAYHFAYGKLTYVYWGNRGKPLANARVIVDQNIEHFMRTMKGEIPSEWNGSISVGPETPPGYGIAEERWKTFRTKEEPFNP